MLEEEEDVEIISDIELAQLLPHHRINSPIYGFAAVHQGEDLIIDLYDHHCPECYNDARNKYYQKIYNLPLQRVMISPSGCLMSDYLTRKTILRQSKVHCR